MTSRQKARDASKFGTWRLIQQSSFTARTITQESPGSLAHRSAYARGGGGSERTDRQWADPGAQGAGRRGGGASALRKRAVERGRRGRGRQPRRGERRRQAVVARVQEGDRAEPRAHHARSGGCDPRRAAQAAGADQRQRRRLL